jgi:hypothetical protein
MVCALGVIVACSGCAKPESPSPAQTAASAPQSAPIQAMTPDAKRSAIAASFPIEVPVPDGEFTRAQAQGSDAWDYTLKVKAAPAAVLDWYRQAYTSRQWEFVGQSTFGANRDGRPGTALTFVKGNSECQVAVDDAAGSDGMTTVRVILGVGAPVLQTQ